ncbi:hypothetical protein BC834DRAFT_861886 [Gloeopeniophorella convolvens]|nr:hypothetical protein BC834DRAFT_861886 [Gloeopeniophorella convolvens]
MNYFQTTSMGNNFPQDDVPQQPYAEPVEFKSALVDEFLAELGITSLEFNPNNTIFPGYQSPTPSLSEVSETAGPSRGPDEWVDHVTVNRGNASYDSITDYAPATMAFTPEFTVPSVPDHTIVDPYYLTQPVLDSSPSAVAQPSPSPALPLRPVGMASDLYLPPLSHVSNLPIATPAEYLSSLPYDITNSGGAIIDHAFDLHELPPVEFELLDPNQMMQPSWLPRDDAEAGWASQNGRGHLDFSPNTFFSHDNMYVVTLFSESFLADGKFAGTPCKTIPRLHPPFRQPFPAPCPSLQWYAIRVGTRQLSWASGFVENPKFMATAARTSAKMLASSRGQAHARRAKRLMGPRKQLGLQKGPGRHLLLWPQKRST